MILGNLYKGLSFFDIFNWINFCELEHGQTNKTQILLNCVWKCKTRKQYYFWEQRWRGLFSKELKKRAKVLNQSWSLENFDNINNNIDV